MYRRKTTLLLLGAGSRSGSKVVEVEDSSAGKAPSKSHPTPGTRVTPEGLKYKMGELVGQGTHGNVWTEQGAPFLSADAVTAWSIPHTLSRCSVCLVHTPHSQQMQ